LFYDGIFTAGFFIEPSAKTAINTKMTSGIMKLNSADLLATRPTRAGILATKTIAITNKPESSLPASVPFASPNPVIKKIRKIDRVQIWIRVSQKCFVLSS